MSPDFQVRTQALGLACLNLQGQFEQERGRMLFGGLVPIYLTLFSV